MENKNFILNIMPADWSRETEAKAIDLRDTILAEVQEKHASVRVIDAPSNMSIALISCTQSVADDIKASYPAVQIAPEVRFELPKPPFAKLKPPRR
jgi:hypothetical protein